MSSIRLGLKPVSNNSPAIGSLLNLKHTANDATKNTPKVNLNKPVVPSPLVLFEQDNKENATQTNVPEVSCCSSQTEVSVSKQCPEVTDKDLCADKPTATYWRSMAEELTKEIDGEMDRSLTLSFDLDQSISELQSMEEKMDTLKEVVADIENEETEQ